VPYDANETFFTRDGKGGGKGKPGGGKKGGPKDVVAGPPDAAPPAAPSGNPAGLDPLVAADDARRPLLSKMLQVPALRARYLACVHEIAEQWLDWKRLGPLAQQYRTLIDGAVKADTRRLYSYEAFT
jgi:hypothetical protein